MEHQETTESLTTVKLFTKTLVQLRVLKKELKLKGIKETVQYLFDVYANKVELPATIHQEIREQQAHILDLCKQIKAKIDDDIQTRNNFSHKQDNGDEHDLVPA